MKVVLVALALLVAGRLAYSGTLAAAKKAKPAKSTSRKSARTTRKNRRYAHRAARAAGPTYTVTATTYHAVAAQTDSHPFVTADNSTIRRGYGSRQRWLAVSQDLLKQGGGRIHYGDRVRVRGISPGLDGVYTVHDTMHKRHRRRIDILSHPREKLALAARNVKLGLVAAPPQRKRPAGMTRLADKQTRPGRRVASRPARTPHRVRARRPAYLVAAMR